MKLRSLSLLLMLAVGFAACKNNDPVGPGTPSDKATFTVGSEYKFFAYQTDTTEATKGQKIAGTEDTLTQVVIANGLEKAGKTNVTAILSTSTYTGFTDTIFYAQDNDGNVYRYNYGLEALGNDPAVIGVLGGSIDVGWVHMTKLNAKVGDGWTTGFDTIDLPSAFGKAYLSDTVTYLGTSTISIGGTNYSAHHTSHVIRPQLPGHTAAGTIDNYFVPEIGATVISTTSPSYITGFLYNAKFPGQHVEMYQKVK